MIGFLIMNSYFYDSLYYTSVVYILENKPLQIFTNINFISF